MFKINARGGGEELWKRGSIKDSNTALKRRRQNTMKGRVKGLNSERQKAENWFSATRNEFLSKAGGSREYRRIRQKKISRSKWDD